MAWSIVEIESIMKEADPSSNTSQADLKINGIREAKRTTFFDNRFVNAEASSYTTKDQQTISRDHALQNHNKYDPPAEDVRESFTLLICSVECVRNTVCSTKDQAQMRHCQCNGGSPMPNDWMAQNQK